MIHAVIFDLGGTLEDVYYDDALRLAAMPGLHAILAHHQLELPLSMNELYAVVKAGMKKYGAWRQATEQELPPERVWSEFVFAGQCLPREKLYAIAEELAFYWDAHCSRRNVRPEARTALQALHERGCRLGVISNIISRTMVPCKLREYAIADYFEVVLTSCTFGWRKPSPRIFLEMARLLNLAPADCAYVGDTISRDVVGAHRAGYGLAIQIKSFLTTQSDQATDIEPPDALIENLTQVVDVIDPFVVRNSNLFSRMPSK